VVVYGAVTADKMNIYHNGVLLGKEQINQAFAQSIALDIYKAGKRKNNWGTGLTIAGYAVIGIGLYGLAMDLGEEYYDFALMIDLPIMAAGGGLLIGGYKLKSTARKKVKQAVDVHNDLITSTSSNLELNLGFTQNRIGLVLNF